MTHKKVDRGERVVYMVFYYVAYKHTYFTLRERTCEYLHIVLRISTYMLRLVCVVWFNETPTAAKLASSSQSAPSSFGRCSVSDSPPASPWRDSGCLPAGSTDNKAVHRLSSAPLNE
jgi:hypothetical protein